jgi:predicted phage terminase large subunit-like protein
VAAGISAALDLDPAYLADADLAAADARQRWLEQARDPDRMGKQLPPTDLDWEIYLMVAGRGFGKTAAQVEWGWWEAWRCPIVVHAVAPTLSDIRGTLFEGPAGFNATVPAECLLGGTLEKAYNKSTHELRLSNGSLIRGFGAVEEAGRLRGPQCHALICDELREWDRPAGNLKLAMNNALFGLRLRYPDGTPSRAVMGTTPKPIPFLKQFEKRPGVRVVRGTSYENLKNLSASYRSQLMSLAGTAMGRQEIDAVYIDDESDLSILKRGWIRLWPLDPRVIDPRTGRPVHKPLPVMSFILESYDTAASEDNFDVKKQETDPTACIVLGIFNIADNFTPEERKRMKLRSRYGALLLHCWSERLGLPELLDKARAQHRQKWGPLDRARRADVVLVEDKSSGPGLRQFLTKWGVPAWPCKPRGNKAMRFHAISPLVHQGMLWVPESMRQDGVGEPIAWAGEFMDQVCAFAGEGSVEHDDYVDTLSQAFGYLRENNYLLATPEEQFADLEEKIEHDRAEAKRLYEAERREKRGAPYG